MDADILWLQQHLESLCGVKVFKHGVVVVAQCQTRARGDEVVAAGEEERGCGDRHKANKGVSTLKRPPKHPSNKRPGCYSLLAECWVPKVMAHGSH